MKLLRRIPALIIGFVFFISGMLKLMDPVGTSLIVGEYLTFFHIGFLRFAAYALGAMLALCETILGATLICGVWKKPVAFLLMVLLCFFTVVTLILLIFNPSMDCGCFGEAVHLTHLESFIKNLVLLALWALAYVPLRKASEPTRKIKFVSFGVAAVSTLLFFLYSSLSIPLVDFTDYKPGTELMGWEDVDFESGELPVMLSFSDAGGEYADSLVHKGKVMVVSVYDPSAVSGKRWDRISAAVRNAHAEGYLPLVLVSSTPDEIASHVARPELLPDVYFADRKDLLTLNRSNGGYTYIADGQIIRKWSAMTAPSSEKLAEIAATDPVEVMIEHESASSLKLQGFLLYVFAVMLLL